MCMGEGCCAAAMGRWERSRVRAHVELTEVGYIQLLLLMCATIRYHFAWFYYVMIRECCGSAVIVSVSKARCKMRLSLLCIRRRYISWDVGLGMGRDILQLVGPLL